MATEENIEFGDDGTATVHEAKAVAVPAPQMSLPGVQDDDQLDGDGVEKIAGMIANPATPVADIMRLLALEMAKVVKLMMSKGDPLTRSGRSQRDLNDMLKGLREMQKTVMDSDALSKKDVLNFDGPKFQYVFGEIVGLFQKALKGAGIVEQDTRNVMTQFADLVKTNDESLRRELNKI